MKKFLFSLLSVALIFAGCAEDSSSEAPFDVPAISSSVEESSASYETPCSVPPTLNLGWPKDGSYISNLETDFTADLNTISCDTKIEVKEATLFYEDSTTKTYNEVGKFSISSVQDAKNSRVWHISYNLKDLDAKYKLADGYYKVSFEIYGTPYKTTFKLVRSFEEIAWTLDFSNQSKRALIKCEGCRYGSSIIYKTLLLDAQEKIVTEVPKSITWAAGVTYHLDSIYNLLPTGRYTLRFIAIYTNVASNEETYSFLRAYGENKDSVDNAKFTWAIDKDFNIRQGILGTIKDTVFVVDNDAPEIANVPKEYVPTVYRVGGHFKTHFKFTFDIIESVYEAERPLKVSLEAAGYDEDKYKTIYSDSILLKTDTTSYQVNFLDTALKYENIYSIRIKIEDEYQKAYYANLTAAYILEDFVEDFTLSEFWVPAKIPSKLYDCEKYKCQDVSFLNPDVEYGELLDERDNRVYRTLQVGDQVWMAQNLNYEVDSSYCYDNDSANCEMFGRLYTWNIAVGKSLEDCPLDAECDLSSDYIDDKMHVRGICPAGYHVPSDSDYFELGRYYGRIYGVDTPNHMFYFAKHLLSPYKWLTEEENVNTSGFTMLPSGMAFPEDDGSIGFSGNDWDARYWTSSKDPNADAKNITCWESHAISTADTYAYVWIHCPRAYSHGLRCVKD